MVSDTIIAAQFTRVDGLPHHLAFVAVIDSTDSNAGILEPHSWQH